MSLVQKERRPESCISDLTFDEWEAGELRGDVIKELEAHLAACARCRARDQALRAHAECVITTLGSEFVPSSKTAHTSVVLPRKYGGQGIFRAFASARLWIAMAVGIVTVAAAVIVINRPVNHGGILRKGRSHIGFFVRHGERVYRGADGERVRPGDQLRFTIRPDRVLYLAIVSLDKRGTACVYYPPPGARQRFNPGADEIWLDASVKLDNTLGAEQIIALLCSAPLSAGQARLELETTGRIAPRPDCEVETFQIIKEKDPL